MDDSQIIKYYDSGDKDYPCNPNSKAVEFLNKIGRIENLREDYLDKTIKTHCAKQKFDDYSDNS